MPQVLGRLTASTLSRINSPGFYADGGGLYLQVGQGGARSWIYRFTTQGRSRDMGLGSATDISLAEARRLARDCRVLRNKGLDPIDERKKERQAGFARGITFKDCARAYIDAHRPAWRNAKHAAQWDRSLDTHVHGVLGPVPVQDVDTALVLKVLEPIWTTKTETATRIRARIEVILDWAKAKGYRAGENPARWRGHLQNILPAPSRLHRPKHHNALPYQEAPAFFARVKAKDRMTARLLEFIILTAARRGEAMHARWSEIDFEHAVWTVPGERMKAGREHRVPLSGAAMRLLTDLRENACSDLIFPSRLVTRPFSDMAITELLMYMGRKDITTHGFRSTFRDWAAERTNFPREVAEMALAHTIENKVEAAYRRGDLFEKRRKLMEAWGRYCDQARGEDGSKVVDITSSRMPRAISA